MAGRKTVSGDNAFIDGALKYILENNSDYVFVVDTDLVYRFASLTVAQMAGFSSPADIIGRTDYEIFPKELAEKYRADDIRVMKTDSRIDGAIEQLPDADGKERWTQTWKFALRDNVGNVIGVCGISRDVSRMIKLENNSQVAERYIDLINNIPAGVGIYHEKDGVFYRDYANESLFTTHCFSYEYGMKFSGSNADMCIFEPDRRLLKDAYEKFKNADGDGRVSYRVVSDDGSLHWVEMTFRNAYKKDGLQYYYVSFTNIDKQKEAELKMKESQETLKSAISNSNMQYFTYYPDNHRIEIYVVSRRYSMLPTSFENYPESFLEYVKPSESDAHLYREMVSRIDRGEDSAECTIQVSYKGVKLWLNIHMTAVREGGHTVRALGYSTDITARKEAEERIRKERLHQKELEGNVIEVFSFNVTKNALPELHSASAISYSEPIDDELVKDTENLAPPITDSQAKTRQVMLGVANQIPDPEERRMFINTCSGEALRKACSEGRYETVIKYRRRVGDVVRWVSTDAEVLPDPDTGDFIAFFYTRDITDEVFFEKLEDSLIKKDYEAISYYDVQKNILHSKTANKIIDAATSGLNYDDAIYTTVHERVLPEEIDKVMGFYSMRNITSHLEKTPVYTFYYTMNERAENLPGRPHKIYKDTSFYLDETHEAIAFLLADVTEIFERERGQREKLAEALNEAEKANAAKTEFLSRISHDIRTPISIISSMTDFAFEDADDREKLTEELTKIKASTSFLLSLINDVLDISKIDSGKIELHPEPYPFDEYAAVIRGMFEPVCQQKGLRFVMSSKSSTTGCIFADKIRINQIVLNIISNAVKYTPEGGTITYTSKSRNMPGGRILYAFEVSDTGIGMSDRFQRNLFKPFTQEFDNPERAKAETGTGLGLAIVKRMVDIMGGEVTVKSVLGKGTAINVSIVFPDASTDPDYIYRTQQKKSRLERKKLKGKVLLAEDNEINTEIALRIIESFGLEAVTACNGVKAVEKFESSAPGEYDIILMDIQMPLMNGYEAAKKIRGLERTDASTVPIVAMTADAFAEAVIRCKKAGMNEHITKPIDPDLLYATIDRFMNC